MSQANTQSKPSPYTVVNPAPHVLHRCRDAAEFCSSFEALAGWPVQRVADDMVAPSAAKAIFLAGSIPLGMATSGSDVDFIVLIDDVSALRNQGRSFAANTDQHLAFMGERNPLLAGNFVTLTGGVGVEVQIALTPGVNHIHKRLRSRGPELSESEIITLGRLSTGWLLWQSDGYLERNAVNLADPALHVYCSTRNFVAALNLRRKALGALDLADIPLCLHLGYATVEMAYLAYFASEGYSYLGRKWLAQIGSARGAAQRVKRHPLLLEGVPLLFPSCGFSAEEATLYLRKVSGFLTSIRDLIQEKTLFRIAYLTCPQIHPV
jgi:hypothetical protein